MSAVVTFLFIISTRQLRVGICVFYLFLLLSLTGCTPNDAASQLQDYQSRLSRTLDTTLPAMPDRATLNYPDKNELLLTTTAIEIDLTELYQIQTCRLGSLVAERNTALGKVQAYSVRLIYEYRLIRALQQCIDYYQQTTTGIDNRESQLATMQQWLNIKTADFHLHWSNMLTLSDETKQAFSRPLPGLLSADHLDITGQVATLQQLQGYKETNINLDERLETHLKQTALLRLPASIWLATKQLAQGLPILTRELARLLPEQHCGQGHPDDTASILRNVFYLSFIENIQPVGSRINAFHYAFEPLSEQWQNDPVLPYAFKAYLRQQTTTFEEYQRAMKAHIKIWQTFLARCNMSPGGS